MVRLVYNRLNIKGRVQKTKFLRLFILCPFFLLKKFQDSLSMVLSLEMSVHLKFVVGREEENNSRKLF